MQTYQVILRTLDGDDELEGYHFPEHNASFAFEWCSGIFTFHSGKPSIIEGHRRAWSCSKNDELKAFNEFLTLWVATGEEPVEGRWFIEEI